MNTVEVLNCLNKIVDHSDFQIGVLASNELSKVDYQKNFCIIVNSDPSYLSGRHWVSFFKKEDTVYFFCSFGHSVDFYGSYFTHFAKMVSTSIHYNPVQIQSNYSSICGQYCLYFLYCSANGILFDSFLNVFTSDDLIQNDFIVEKFFCKISMFCNDTENCKCILKSSCNQKCLRRVSY